MTGKRLGETGRQGMKTQVHVSMVRNKEATEKPNGKVVGNELKCRAQEETKRWGGGQSGER